MGKYIIGKGGVTNPGSGEVMVGAIAMLAGLSPIGMVGSTEMGIKLFLGSPGAAGTANPAAETKQKTFAYLARTPEPGFGEGENYKLGRWNVAAIEWPEVTATETYKWVGLFFNGVFVMGIELTAPVAVTKGDTFRINGKKLLVKYVLET